RRVLFRSSRGSCLIRSGHLYPPLNIMRTFLLPRPQVRRRMVFRFEEPGSTLKTDVSVVKHDTPTWCRDELRTGVALPGAVGGKNGRQCSRPGNECVGRRTGARRLSKWSGA